VLPGRHVQMNLIAPVRLPAQLESAIQRVRMAARTAAERTVDSLGLAALSSSNVYQRDSLLGAQFELNRKLAIFALNFNDTLEQKVSREVAALDGASTSSGSSWDALSLVDDHELEIQVSADRFALEINHACEWEIRDLDAYLGTLLGLGRCESARNPLRAEIIGQAMIRAVEAVADRPEVRKVLGAEIGRSLAQAMRETYVEIINDMRSAGIKPVGMSVRQRPGDAGRRSRMSGFDGAGVDAPVIGHGLTGSGRLTPRQSEPGQEGLAPVATINPGTPMGRIDSQMMALIRRLSQGSFGMQDADDPARASGWDELPRGAETHAGLGMLMAPNLIVAHREDLRRAASGAIDHMVIDVIAGLFDQILSDPKVPPQIARQIARLQLPVLRAALGDTSFFSSRKHPVRRLINRIASLGAAVDDFDSPDGQALLTRVRELVQEIVGGDFEQVELYEQKLASLEYFISEQAKAQVSAAGAADRVLARKEELLRVQQRYAQQLGGALQSLAVPDFLRQFLAQTWSRAIAGAELEAGPASPLAKRMREVGRELAMSVQPKGVPAQRAAFLRQLPQLMKDLHAGLDRIRCSEAVRHDFFAQLLPAHAQSLSAQALSTLEFNLLHRQVENVMATPVPKASELPPAPASALPVTHEATLSASFSPEEAQAVGLVEETSIDWNGQVDIDLSAEPEITSSDLDIEGLPPPEPVEPTRGRSLADHVQIGFAYQMHVEGAWRKVRLTHVSPARTFFVFTHGAKQRKTISMTYRMLTRMCETGRMRAFENAYLIERATARTRRQLAQLKVCA